MSVDGPYFIIEPAGVPQWPLAEPLLRFLQNKSEIRCGCWNVLRRRIAVARHAA
jgi:hypothetical protein